MVELDWAGQVTEMHYSKVVFKLVNLLSEQVLTQIHKQVQADPDCIKNSWVPQLSRRVNRIMTVMELLEDSLYSTDQLRYSSALNGLQKMCAQVSIASMAPASRYRTELSISPEPSPRKETNKSLDQSKLQNTYRSLSIMSSTFA